MAEKAAPTVPKSSRESRIAPRKILINGRGIKKFFSLTG